MADTTKLLGDGRHRMLRFNYEGKQLLVRFQGADFEVSIYGLGTNIPVSLADRLFNQKGSGIRFPGGVSKDDLEQERREKEKLEAEKNPSRQEAQEANRNAPPTETRLWPRHNWSRDRLLAEGVKLGNKKRSLETFSHKELLQLVQDGLANKYPAWAEQVGYKPGGAPPDLPETEEEAPPEDEQQ